ncbi:hypothetical protein FPOAC1_002608 [Fusarium poae]|uniref:hypothetical protein n=1 Tax=Fusarium poae TaxID=36050 RepID=UPI001CE85EC2|nr:hypothetical protein FPOAC1_002608 [Fusarium poae]KAG8676601.1 hypothetical protein FPOAC1_002608 [Fusarium poae]
MMTHGSCKFECKSWLFHLYPNPSPIPAAPCKVHPSATRSVFDQISPRLLISKKSNHKQTIPSVQHYLSIRAHTPPSDNLLDLPG